MVTGRVAQYIATESSKNTMLLMCDSNRSLYFLDSKFQRDRGALIASVTHVSREAIVDWIDQITKLNWNVAPNIGSVMRLPVAEKPLKY